MKRMVIAAEWSAAEALDFSCEVPFLEPALFTHFGPQETRTTLEQILYGYLPEMDRPGTIQAYAGENGVVYLPRVGYFKTDWRNSVVTLAPRDSLAVRSVIEPGIEICDLIASPFDGFLPEANSCGSAESATGCGRRPVSSSNVTTPNP